MLLYLNWLKMRIIVDKNTNVAAIFHDCYRRTV